MTTATATPTNFENLDFPNTVYKYREAENFRHRTILTERIVYFSSPALFADKLDCKIPIRYDLSTDDEIYNHYYATLKEANPKWDHLYLRDQTIRWANMNLLRNTEHIAYMDAEYFKSLNERLGVLCLTANATNAKMWQKYSNKFNGFCVGFDPKIMFKFLGGGGIVHYVKELPIIKPTDCIDVKIIQQTYFKLKKWEFEDEYRTKIFWPYPAGDADRKIEIPNHAFSEIILGHNIKTATTKEIIDQAKAINPNIKIKKTRFSNNKISLMPYA